MKKILQLTKAIILTMAAVIMLLNTNVLTAQAGIIMFPGMTKTEDGRIRLSNCGSYLTTDSTGRKWSCFGCYPFCTYDEPYEVIKHGMTITCYDTYLECYLTDIIRTCDESEWPSFVVKGSDGVPFYYQKTSNYHEFGYYARCCYDEKSGWWLEDKTYKGPNIFANTMEEVVEETRTAIENGEIINGTPVDPASPLNMDKAAEYNPDDDTITYSDGRVTSPDGHTEYPDGRMVYPDGHVEYMGADFNSLADEMAVDSLATDSYIVVGIDAETALTVETTAQ